jgi:hypothetical protein
MSPIPLTPILQWLAILNHKKPELYSYVAIVIGLVVIAISTDWINQTDKFSFSIQVLTLIGLLFIKLNQIKKDWLDSIPNYLNVDFYYNGQLQIKTEFIPLVSLAGVREQAQTLAMSLNGGKYAPIYPVLHQIKHGEIKKIEDEKFEHNNQPIELHQASIELQVPFPELMKEQNYNVNVDIGEYLYWGYPFSTAEIKIKDKNHQTISSHINQESSTQ